MSARRAPRARAIVSTFAVLGAACASPAQAAASTTVLGNNGVVVSDTNVGRDLHVTINQESNAYRRAVLDDEKSAGRRAVDRDLDARMQAEMLAEQLRGDPVFAEFLALMTGATGRVNVEEALAALNKAPLTRSGLLTMYLGIAYRNGWGVPADRHQADTYMAQAADLGVAGAQNFLVDRFWDGSDGYPVDKQKSTRYLQQLVDNESAQAAVRARGAYYLANRLINGDGIGRNVCLGMKRLASAAVMGEKLAMRQMGFERRDQSRCLPTDSSIALAWFEKGAEAGDDESSYQAGWMLYFGKAGARDFGTAERYLLLAETPAADYLLAWIYGKGLAGDKAPDYDKALSYARRSADKGNGAAMDMVGLLFEYGLGTRQNVTEAFRWYGKAAEAGESRGLVNQAVTVMNGCVRGDLMPQWATQLETVARTDANLDERNAAAFHLALAYAGGLGGLAQDRKAAQALFLQACKGGKNAACAQVDTASLDAATQQAVSRAAASSATNDNQTDGDACRRRLVEAARDPDVFP